MGMWKNFTRDRFDKVSQYAEFYGLPLSKLTIAIILAVVLVILIPLNLLPYLRRGDKLKFIPWLYFFLIGMAFMSVEVVLIQKYTLFIGASVYSIATVLLVLLVSSGVGSRFADLVASEVVFLSIAAWLVLDVLVLRQLTGALAILPQSARVIVAAVLIAPLGFFMGMPFPKGALRVGDLVDWGFAVNGAASVLGATLIVLVAFTYGFTAALLAGAFLYLGAFGLMAARKGW